MPYGAPGRNARRRRNLTASGRYGPKKKDEEKWGHSTKSGWIRFQRCLGQVVVATIQARDEAVRLDREGFTRDLLFRGDHQAMAPSCAVP